MHESIFGLITVVRISLALGGSTFFLTGCLTYTAGSDQTSPPSAEPTSTWEFSFSRVSPSRTSPQDLPTVPVLVPLLPDRGDFSPSFSGTFPDKSFSGSGYYPFPALKEEREVSFPRTEADAKEALLLRYSHEPSPTVAPLFAGGQGTMENRQSALSPVQPPYPTAKDEPVRQIPPKEVNRQEVAPKQEAKQEVSPQKASTKEEPKKNSAKPEDTLQEGKVLPKDPFPLPQKKVEGEVGKTVRIVLPGVGWIYLGEKDRTGKVKYLGKDTGDDATTFTFSITQEGDTVLQFQQQDLLAKLTTYDSVLVTASREPMEAPQEKPVGKEGGSIPPGEKASLAGSPPPAIKEVLEGSPAEPFHQQVDRLVKEGKKKEAVLLIEEYLQSKESASSLEMDRWYFALAQMYERDGDVKDIKKALYYYEKVRDQFPFSPYWEEADYRSRYIRRNFFEIR